MRWSLESKKKEEKVSDTQKGVHYWAQKNNIYIAQYFWFKNMKIFFSLLISQNALKQESLNGNVSQK